MGNCYLFPWKNKITISTDHNFEIIIKLKNGYKFSYNKIINNKKEYILPCEEIIIKKFNNDSTKITGYENFISNLSILFKKFIIKNKIKDEKLNTFYKMVFNLCKEILKNI